MLTEYTSRISHYSKQYHALLNLTKSTKSVSRHKQPSRRRPTSTANKRCKRDLPRPVPSFNPHAKVDASHAAKIRDDILDMMGHECAFLAPLTSDDSLLVLDSSCSIATSPDINDFLDGTYLTQDCTISGIGSGLTAQGIGTIQWSLTNISGSITTLELQCLYVPDAPCCLLPPQQLGASKPQPNSLNGAWIGQGLSAKVIHNGSVINFPYHPKSNLPCAQLIPGNNNYCRFIDECNGTATPIMTPEGIHSYLGTFPNHNNRTAAQQKLLRLHHRLGHTSMLTIQQWAKQGLYNIPLDVASVTELPVCLACAYGAAKCHGHHKSTGSIGVKATKPGDFVSVDTMQAGTPGIIPFPTGLPSKHRYTNSTVWVNKVSQYLRVDHQETMTAKETLLSKEMLESFAATHNRRIKHIHSDNGIYAKSSFINHMKQKCQSYSFCGVGAKWQNGSVESHIGHLTAKARSMLMHAMQKWPGIITPAFWPFCISQAVRMHNLTPHRGQSRSPHEIFTDEDSSITPADFRTMLCPVFVLEKELQDGKKLPKFSKAHSHIGVYVGHSPHHASNVVLVYNPTTGLVSPQYHVVFDEAFSTVASDNPTKIEYNISKMFNSLWADNIWSHTDQFISDDSPRHLFFDEEWNISRKTENLHQ